MTLRKITGKVLKSFNVRNKGPGLNVNKQAGNAT